MDKYNTHHYVFVAGEELLSCMYCQDLLPLYNSLTLIEHCKFCLHNHRPDKTYTFTCFACEYHTAKRAHIREHIRQHTGERPFPCMHCDYKARKKSNLTKHILSKHQI